MCLRVRVLRKRWKHHRKLLSAGGRVLPRSHVCERHDALLDIEGVIRADDLFQGIADRFGGEFDGWQASV